MTIRNQHVRPLDNTNVLEICHYIAGPYSAQILGDQGASVVKLEPHSGEAGRRALPVDATGESLYYASYNRNKRNVALDLTKPESRAALDSLLKWADVVITNYSVGTPEKLGFGWDRLHEINPAAIMIFISGFGSYSKFRDYVAFDGIVTAMSGIASMNGSEDGPPYIGNVLLGDHVTALQTAMAASTALHLRTRTGEGTFVEVSMLRSLASLLGDHVPAAATLGQRPTRHGNRSTLRFGNTFPTSDGHIVIAPLTAPMWHSFCTLIGRPEWGGADIVAQRIHVHDETFRREIETVAADWISVRSSQNALELLQSLGIPAGAIRSISEVCEDDEPKNLRLFERVTLANGGEATVLGRVFDWNEDVPNSFRNNVVSALGADSAEALIDAGMDPDDVVRLREYGVILAQNGEEPAERGITA